MNSYETSDYAVVEGEQFGSRRGWRVKSRSFKEGRSWRSDGVLFRNQKDAETVARLVAKACHAEELATTAEAANV